jgi:hypothetical protein
VSKSRTRLAIAVALGCLVGAASPALAFDGFSMVAPPDGGAISADTTAPSYYEQVSAALGGISLADSTASGGLPKALQIVDAGGAVRYRSLGADHFEVTVEVAERPHEHVDAVYDLVLALPLPVSFRADAWRIAVRTGQPGASAPVVYSGEQVGLKRNTPLEGVWLPLLVGANDGLPDLTKSGYQWTLWDTIVRYDAGAGPTLQGFTTLDYTADPTVPALDPGDSRSAAYVISWVPTLDASVPPFTLRLPVTAPAEE